MKHASFMSASRQVRRTVVLAAGLALVTVGAAHAQSNADPGMMRGDGPNSSRQNVPQQTEKQFPIGVPWMAVSLNNKNYPADRNRPYFTLDSQYQLRGFGGCNTFSATAYPLRSQGFAVSPFAMTRKSCGAAIDAAERAFMLALRMSQKWDVVKGQLVLQGSAGAIHADRSL